VRQLSGSGNIRYAPRPDATPEAERSALAAVYRYLLDCRARKAVAHSEKEIAQKERRPHDLTDVTTKAPPTQKPESERSSRMGVGVTQTEPITAMRAVLQIEDAEVVDSKFTDQKGREQKQFATTLKVLSGAGERDGETFTEWFSFPASGDIGPKTKAGQMLSAVLGEEAQAETLDELAAKLVGKTFAAQVGTSKDGQHARVVHDTISAVPQQTAVGDRLVGGGDGPEEDVENAPW
jgi:hypothetical protein